MPVQAQSSSRSSRHAPGYAACALAGCCWGTGFYFSKIALSELSVEHMLFYRFLFASIGLLPILRRPRFNARQWMLLLLATFLGIPLQFLLQFYGLALTTVSHAALMVGTMPVILAVGATLFTHERLDAKGWTALLGSTSGVALIVLSSTSGGRHAAGDPSLSGDLLVVVSLVIALGWILLNQRLMFEGQSPLAVTGWGVLIGSFMLNAGVVIHQGWPPVRGLSLRVWIAVVASGFVCTAASTLLWNWGIHHVPASRAGVFLNIEPALGSILGVALLGDRLGPAAWVGGAFVIAAAVILTTTGKQHDPEALIQ